MHWLKNIQPDNMRDCALMLALTRVHFTHLNTINNRGFKANQMDVLVFIRKLIRKMVGKKCKISNAEGKRDRKGCKEEEEP